MLLLRNKQVVILGASGRIGFDLCERLSRENQVVGVARFRDREKKNRLEQLGVETIALDLAQEDLTALPEDADVLFIEVAYQHGAEAHPELAEALNIHLPARAMQYFRFAKSIVFASTGNVYGIPGRIVTEADRPAPSGVYGLTRYAGEQVVKFFSSELSLPAVILRYFYGNDARYGIVKKMAEALLSGKAPPVEFGYEINCIAHSELVEKTLAAAAHAAVPPRIMNVTSSQPYPLPEIIRLIADRLRLHPPELPDIAARKKMTLAATTPVQDELIGPTRVSLEEIVATVCRSGNLAAL